MIDSLQQVVDSLIEDSLKVIALGELSWEYHIHDKEKALQFAQQELTLAREIDFTKGIGLGHMDLGVTYSYHGAYAKAIDHYQEALPYFQKSHKPLLQALMHYNTAVAYSKYEASEKAIEYFLKALDLLEKQEDWAHVSQSYTGIANSYATLKQFQKAIAYHKKAVSISEKHTDWEMLAVALSDFSGTYNAMYDAYQQKAYLDSSLLYLHKVHDLLASGKVQNPIMMPTVVHNLGNIYFQQEKYDQAMPLIRQAMVLAEPVHLKGAICQGNMLLGKMYTRQKDYAKAIEHLNKALPVALETNPLFASDTYEALFEWAIAQEKFKEAVAFQQKWSDLKDSIYNIEKTEVAERLEVQYENEKKKAQISALEQQYQYERKRNSFYVALSVLGVLVSALVFYMLKLNQKVVNQKEKLLQEAGEKALLQQELAKKQKEKLQEALQHQEEVNALQQAYYRKEIDYKERELTTNVLLLEQNSAFLQKIKNQLQAILPKANGLEEDIRKVYKLIDRQLLNEQDFEKFMIHFEKVHPAFFDRLRAFSSHQLTLTDQKLSAYIRMKLSTKEIAHLLNVEPKSIQMARYRLKQKLNLAEEKDLVTFIQAL